MATSDKKKHKHPKGPADDGRRGHAGRPVALGPPKPRLPVPAPAPAPTDAPPAEPNKVDPFFTADDLAAINNFSTSYLHQLQDIDYGLEQLRIDTDYQKTKNDKDAKQTTVSTADNMAARGLFRSSIKDAALYDVEASRALAQKFLDDRMTAATLNAGTQKKLLADSKVGFDLAMDTKKVDNARGVNDTNSGTWADAMSQWTRDHPPAPTGPAPAAPKPAAAKPLSPAAGANRQRQTAAENHGVAVAKAQARPRKPTKLASVRY